MTGKVRSLAMVFTGVVVLICSYILLRFDAALAQKDPVTLDVRTLVAQESYEALKQPRNGIGD